MRTLDFALKNQWFDQIARGRKKVEYRSLDNPYYAQKFVNVDSYSGKSVNDVVKGLKDGTLKPRWNELTHIRFHCMGRTMLVEVKGIRLERESKVYAIDLGKVIQGKMKENVPE